MGIESHRSLEGLMDGLDLAGKRVTVIPHGGYVLPQSESTYRRLNGEFREGR